MIRPHESSPLLPLRDRKTVDRRAELVALLSLAAHVVATTTLEFLPGFTSTILAGHLQSPRTKELVDAATLSTMFTNMSAYSVGLGLSSAMDTLASQAFGAGRLDRIGLHFQSGLFVLAGCLPPLLVANFYTASVLIWLRQDPTVAALAQDFSRYNLIGIPGLLLYELCRKALQAQGVVVPVIVVSLIGNAIHLGAGYTLAYHTSWGFLGIAISRSVANLAMLGLIGLYFVARPASLSRWWRGWQPRVAIRHVPLFLRLGVPGMLMMVMEWWAFEILSLMAGVLPHRVVAISAQAVQLNVVSMVYMLFLGFSVATNIRVGNHLGANAPIKARCAATLGAGSVALLAVFLGSMIALGHSVIPPFFVNDPTTVASASRVLLAWAPFEIAEGLNCVLQGIFRGAGEQAIAARANLWSFYGVALPSAFLLGCSLGWGVEGLWVGYGIGISTSALTLGATMKRWNWLALASAAQQRTAPAM
ncbi:hypothetical protein ATCC90586_000025 [Pythium insidiosum]|nr:hypothetical protein ATCC90586_000025 [Pythium insidiosum]